MAISNSMNGLEMLIRCPRIRPTGAPIFSAARKGDALSVKNLFMSGEASVLDVDENGTSALFWSIHSLLTNPSAERSLKYKEIVEMLLCFEADPFQTDDYMR